MTDKQQDYEIPESKGEDRDLQQINQGWVSVTGSIDDLEHLTVVQEDEIFEADLGNTTVNKNKNLAYDQDIVSELRGSWKYSNSGEKPKDEEEFLLNLFAELTEIRSDLEDLRENSEEIDNSVNKLYSNQEEIAREVDSIRHGLTKNLFVPVGTGIALMSSIAAIAFVLSGSLLVIPSVLMAVLMWTALFIYR